MPLGVWDATQMGATRKFLMAVVALGCGVGCSSSQWEPSWSPKEQKESQKNKIVVLKDAAQLQNLHGFAVGFLLLLIFMGFILNKYSSQSRTNPNPPAAPPWVWVKLRAVTIPWSGSLFPLLALPKGISKWVLRRGCSAPSQHQGSTKIWLF